MVQARMENAILTVINVVVHLYYICIRFIVVFYTLVRVHVYAYTATRTHSHTYTRSHFLFLSTSVLPFVRNCFGSTLSISLLFSHLFITSTAFMCMYADERFEPSCMVCTRTHEYKRIQTRAYALFASFSSFSTRIDHRIHRRSKHLHATANTSSYNKS